ncbi:MAG: hypothetical protein PHI18_03745 [bacterium]|nr:hypothetical protein [bacterium]
MSASNFFQEDSEIEYGFRHLLPGHYVGYFDAGIMSPDFEFDIDPVPDSLLSEWQQFSYINKSLNRHVMTITPATADSVHECLITFLDKAGGSLWRKESLRRGLFFYSTRIGRPLQSDDSTFCMEMLRAYGLEENTTANQVFDCAFNLFAPGSDNAKAMALICAFAERIGRQDVIEVAKQHLSRVTPR